LELFGEGSEATFELTEVLTFTELGGFKRIVAVVGEVQEPHSERLFLQRNARRVPCVVFVASELHREAIFVVRHQRSLSPSTVSVAFEESRTSPSALSFGFFDMLNFLEVIIFSNLIIVLHLKITLLI